MGTIQVVFFSFLFLAFATANRISHGHSNSKPIIRLGAIIDETCRIGKEERIAMEIAVDDFNATSNQRFSLDIKNSEGQPINAAFAAKDLMKRLQVEAIVGAQTWEEVTLIADMIGENDIPLLSFADNIPKWEAEKWRFLLQASPDKHAQMKAIAAMAQSCNWRQVTLLYQDSMSDGILPHLHDSLKEVDAEFSRIITLSPLDSSSSLTEVLRGLKQDNCRVFLVHSSLSLAIRLFETAKKMDMMEKDYAWITTDPITSLCHSIDPSIISSMQGILGVKTYFPEKGQYFQDFYKKFRTRFSRNFPEESNNEPGIFAVQAYDAVRTVALANSKGKYRGKELVESVLRTDFHGLSGKVEFIDMKAAPAFKFQIINIMGKSYRELGFWSSGLGFSSGIDDGAIYSSSMEEMGQVFWPGETTQNPRGWSLPTSGNPLKIGVPVNSGYKEYVKVENLSNDPSFTGFAIEVFKQTLQFMPFNLPYNFIPYNGTNDDLVEQIHLKNFDGVVGDVAIVSYRYEHAEFTYPYTETGLVMIVPTRSSPCNAWLFMKPYTKLMWVLVVAINIYNGFVVWFIERNQCPQLKGSTLNQIGVLFWLSFTTLFSLHGEKLHSNLSRMAMVVWLFMALVITQTYTANLASVLTVQRLEPQVIKDNAMVGYCKGSFLKRYLVEVLDYNPERLRTYTTLKEYAEALHKKEIATAFLEAPLAKLFFAKFCKGFMTVGPTYKVGGFGFALRRGSPLLASMNEALLKVSESGKLLELEEGMITSNNNNKCKGIKMEDDDDDDQSPSLGPQCFRLLFMISGGTSTIALVFFIFQQLQSLLNTTSTWTFIWNVLQRLNFKKIQSLRRVNDDSHPTHENPFPYTFNIESKV